MPVREKAAMLNSLISRDGVDELYKTVASTSVEAYGVVHNEVVTVLFSMAGLAVSQDDMDQATEFLNRTVSTVERLEVKGSRSVACAVEACKQLYKILLAKEDFEGARAQYDKCLEIARLGYREGSVEIATIHSEKARLMNQLGNKDEALEHFEYSLASYNGAPCGGSCIGKVNCVYNMATVLKKLGRLSDALEKFYQCLRLEESLLEQLHTNLIQTHTEIFCLSSELNDKIGSYRSGMMRVVICKYGLGTEHPESIKEFLSFLEEDAVDQFVGQDNLETASIYHHWGESLACQQCHDRALEEHQKALEVREEVLGEHPDKALSRAVGAALENLEEYEDSLAAYRKALALLQVIYGEIDLETAVIHKKIGDVLVEMENQEEALYRYGKALEIYKAEDGTSTDQKDVAEVHNAISVVKESMEEYDDALEQYKEALAIQLALDAEGDASTATSY
ncbi:Tetratricopeptide repeat protein [Seminavis robusta]|uniref:Tetratricopeptide repeat protein n=1 Tax=Seminavis robusta TaxID=568900 RepID=A0A9N8EF62_9STRA|nr:Tetratricopeptide repeat protein [Seminavis robusta]|eukprot:Sro1062_g236990.1 Tetratricopeptide repeat protein (452) ;mRNA; f:25240-26757